MKKSLTVVFATESKSKLKGLEHGFTAAFPDHDITFRAVDARSGVPAQPWGSTQTLHGALNRIADAKQKIPGADYYASNESGIEDDGKTMRIINWVAVEHAGITASNTTTTFEIPPRVARHVRAGLELDAAFKTEFGEKADKNNVSGIGYMTGEVVTRADLLSQATVTSLIPFIRPELFE